MENFPGNSHGTVQRRERREREPRPEKKVEKIVTAGAKRRKTPLGRRVMQSFLGGDTKSVGEYVIGDVLVPAFRDMLMDAVEGGFARMIFPDGNGYRRGGGRSRYDRGRPVPYNQYSRPGGPPREDRREMSQRGRSRHDFGEIVLDSRMEAEEVLDRMFEMLDKYDAVTVSDLYEMCDISSNYTDNKYGWTDLPNNVGVTRVGGRNGGYLLNLPKPEPID